MKCKLCGNEITRSQIEYGDAYKVAPGIYVHVNCRDDQTRDTRDAYYRKGEKNEHSL